MATVLNNKRKLLRLALFLIAFTIVYNLAEGIIAVWSGLRAGSIALEGFGFDSLIEVSAAGVFLWRLVHELKGADEAATEAREQFARKFIGVTFFLLVAYIVLQSAWDLWRHNAPKESLVGIVLAALSIVIMPLLAKAKLKTAGRLNSASLRLEATETICCFYLSVILLVGLGLNALLGWWWADPLGALVMLPWLIREGKEAFEGEACCGCSGPAT